MKAKTFRETFSLKYEESNLIELKRTLDEKMKPEIIAFLNSYLGGTIYVGVNDDGSVYDFSMEERDSNESRVINWIRDEAIYPNCSDFVKLTHNEDGVLEICIESGNRKPYYLKSKGLKPSGVYVRYGRNKAQATQEEIARMIRESEEISYESLISKNKKLTFRELRSIIKQGLYSIFVTYLLHLQKLLKTTYCKFHLNYIKI